MPHLTDQSTSASRATGPKSQLFCPSCGHESPVDGDWRIQATADGDVYGCPDCGTELTVRPTGERTPTTTHDPSAGGSLVARSVRLAFAWMTWPCTPSDGTTTQISRDSGDESGFAGSHCHP